MELDFIDRPKIPAEARAWGEFVLMLFTPEMVFELDKDDIVIDIFGQPRLVSSLTPSEVEETRGGFSAYGKLRELDP